MDNEIVMRILANSPKAFDLLVQTMTAKCADLPAETGIAVAGEKMQKLLILKTPGRHLYDFFDDERIFVTVKLDNPEVWEDIWAYAVYSRIHATGGIGAGSRQRAEELAFEQAFSILEMKLTKS
jgi:hypothetical protein